MEMMKRLQKIVYFRPPAFGPSAEDVVRNMFEEFLIDFSEQEAFVSYLRKHYGERLGKSLRRGWLRYDLPLVAQFSTSTLRDVTGMWCHAFWTSQRRNQNTNAAIEAFHAFMKGKLRYLKHLLRGRPLAWFLYELLANFIPYYQERAFMKGGAGHPLA